MWKLSQKVLEFEDRYGLCDTKRKTRIRYRYPYVIFGAIK